MHQKNQNKYKQHVPVLLNEVLQQLAPKAGDSYLDLTAGYGGHADEVLARTGSLTKATLVDRDTNAIAVLHKKYGDRLGSLRQSDFLTVSQELGAEKRQFDLILADLGVSSPHLNEGLRGFSIAANGPLDMRMDQSQGQTAEQIVNSYSEAALIDILKRYGEEPKAGQIARAIIAARPLSSTEQLASIALQAWPGRSRG